MQVGWLRGVSSLRGGYAVASLAALVAVGVGGLLVFWNLLLRPGDLGTASLPLVALAAGVASTFNPCALPALPGFLTLGAQADDAPLTSRRRSVLSLSAGVGAMSMVIAFGVVVAAAGSGAGGVTGDYTRWVQLGVGIILVLLAISHVANKTTRFPLVTRVTLFGGRIWDKAMGKPSVRNRYLFGAGYVAVGAG